MDVTWIIIAALLAVALLIIFIVSAVRNRRHDDYQDYQPRESRPERHFLTDEEQQQAFGKHGEDVTFQMISEIANSCGGYAYQNVAFGDDDGYSSEIDAVLICKGGFFVIEIKSFKGIIAGDVEKDDWYAIRLGHQEDRTLRNPVKQNQGHINHMKRLGGKGFPYLTSLVIFPYANDISNVKSQVVHDFYSAKEFLLSKVAEGKYSKETVERFRRQFQSFLSRYGISHEEHMARIKEKFDA